MTLKKNVWELSLDEIEYIYRQRHMNHYVHAALKTYHTSSPPLNRPVRPRTDAVPNSLRAFVGKLLEFAPLIGHDDPSYVRAAITFYSYNLFGILHEATADDIATIAQLLAACAYWSIVSEKNDNLPLWQFAAVRPPIDRVRTNLAILQKNDVDLAMIENLVFPDAAEGSARAGGALSLYDFVLNAMCSLIVCMENGETPALVERGLVNTERAMRTYEERHGLADPSSPVGLANAVHLRYRNTLYLYGGMFFTRQGQFERALEWYLKDIYDPALPMYLGRSHPRTFKIIERLLSAYPLVTDQGMRKKLKSLIDRSYVEAFQVAAAYSQRVIDALQRNPENDVRSMQVVDNGETLRYAGGPCREVYYSALLYNKFVLGVDYKDINYAQYLLY